MRAIQKIIKQGNSAMVTLPRPMMITLNWLPGDLLVLESFGDGTLQMRVWKSTQFVQGQSPGVLGEPPPTVTR